MISSIALAREACLQAGLSPAEITEVHEHATAVFVHQPAGVVIRLSRPGQAAEARRAVAIAGWLTGQGFPATAPAPGLPPVEVRGRTVTFWRFYPQPGRQPPPAAQLGHLLRELHRLFPPPITLPAYAPLEDLGEALACDDGLLPGDADWIRQRRAGLISAYHQVRTVLGEGMIHGDAYPGNMLWDGDQVILGDWDEVATGPRELDLVNIYLQGKRFGRPKAELDEFAAAYGYDVTAWSGFRVLLDIRSLHTLGSFIRRAAAGNRSAQAELAHRVRTLKAGDTEAAWHAAS